MLQSGRTGWQMGYEGDQPYTKPCVEFGKTPVAGSSGE